MITIYHGEDITASRKALPDNSLKIDGKEITPEQLAQLLDGQDLFGQQKTLVIENTKKLPENITGDVIFWFDHKLTANQIKAFSGAKIQEFKLSGVVFKFLDSLAPQNQKTMLPLFEQYCDIEVPEIIFSMIVRQIRLMLSPEGLPVWQKSKILTQSKRFTQDQLKTLYKQLLSVDYEIKTGQSPQNLKGSLELLLYTHFR